LTKIGTYLSTKAKLGPIWQKWTKIGTKRYFNLYYYIWKLKI